MTKHYLVWAFGCIDPDVVAGPFETDQEVLAIAQTMHKGLDDEDVLFWLDIDENGVPTIGAFAGAAFDE